MSDDWNLRFVPPGAEPLIDGVTPIIRKYGEDYWASCEREHRFPHDFFDSYAAGGWLSLALPEEYGGGGQGVAHVGAVLHTLANSPAGTNGVSSVQTGLYGLMPVVHHGSEQLKRDVLVPAASGNTKVAFSITEPDAGSDTTRTSTTATKVDGGFVLRGLKVWTSCALEADVFVVIARTTPLSEVSKRMLGLTLFIVDRDDNAMTIRPIPKMGRNTVDSCEVFYDDVFVPNSRVVGSVDEGLYHLMTGLNAERILAAYMCLGAGRWVLRKAVEYARDRHVFGRPIGANQGIAFPLANALARLDAAEALTFQAALAYDAGSSLSRDANSCKYLAADAAFFAADRAVQTLGGFGYAEEYGVERHFRAIRILRVAPLSEELVLAQLAHHALGLPRSY